jgi:hypothetical protein
MGDLVAAITKEGDAEVRKYRMFSVTAMALAAGAIGVLGVATPASASGDGTCSSTDLCVFRNYDQHKSEGYFDLGGPDKDFANGNNLWINASGDINDDITSFSPGHGTTCTGYALFWDKDMHGPKMTIPAGWNAGNLEGAWANFNDEFSSYSKYGCP